MSYGLHSVEAIYDSAQPFFFTTASRVQSDINAEVNFGVGLSFARLFGSVRSDTGIGLSGVEISVSKGRQRFRAQTDAEGRFRVEGLSSGEYQIKIDRDSVPPGYSVTELETQRTMVDPSAPGQCAFTLRAVSYTHLDVYKRQGADGQSQRPGNHYPTGRADQAVAAARP